MPQKTQVWLQWVVPSQGSVPSEADFSWQEFLCCKNKIRLKKGGLGMTGGGSNCHLSLTKPFCFSPGKCWNKKKTTNIKKTLTPLKVDILKRSSNFLLHLKCHHRLLLKKRQPSLSDILRGNVDLKAEGNPPTHAMKHFELQLRLLAGKSIFLQKKKNCK